MADSGFYSVSSDWSLSNFYEEERTSDSATRSNDSLFSNERRTKHYSYFQMPNSRSAISKRLLRPIDDGGYSPHVLSNKEGWSPLSSLAFNFRGHNNSNYGKVGTPRKRLSLSSSPSVNSPQPSDLSTPVNFLLDPLKWKLPATKHAEGEDSSEGFLSSGAHQQEKMEERHKRVLQDKDDNVAKENRNLLPQSKSHSLTTFEATGKENLQIFDQLQGSLSTVSKLNHSAPASCMLMGSRFTPHSTVVTSFCGVSRSPQSISSLLTGNWEDSPKRRPYNKKQKLRNHKRVLVDKSAEVPIAAIHSPGKNTMIPQACPSTPVPFAETSPCTSIQFCKRLYDTSGALSAASKRVEGEESPKTKTEESIWAVALKKLRMEPPDYDSYQPGMAPRSSERGFRLIPSSSLQLCNNDDELLSHSPLCSSNDSCLENDDDIKISLVGDGTNKPNNEVDKSMNDYRQTTVVDFPDYAAKTSDRSSGGLKDLIFEPLLSLALEEQMELSNARSGFDDITPHQRVLFPSPATSPTSTRVISSSTSQREKSTDATAPFLLKRRRLLRHEATVLEVKSPLATHKTMEDPSLKLNRSRSCNELDVIQMIDRGHNNPNLVGDFTKLCSLETVSGNCWDLKYISSTTLVNLLKKTLNVGYFEIIDCRYPYEYEGGHIVGACSMWEVEELFKRYFNDFTTGGKIESESNSRPILIFYCEFSSERGPRLARTFRKRDREINVYPYLHYPEIYILKHGYKDFFHFPGAKVFCDPPSYRQMSHEDFTDELRKCHSKSKKNLGGKTERKQKYNRNIVQF